MQVAVVVVALVGAVLHWLRKRRHVTGPAEGVDTFLVWWLAVAVGVGGLLGAGAHLFDGPATAELIGYTRGDGGFQFENAMGDLAIGVAGVLCVWFRGHFWLAVVIIMSIQYLGDAGGHLYYWLAEGNTRPGNIGPPLWLDFIEPIVAWALYAVSRARGGDALQPGSRSRVSL
ncbi:hypothetical protein LO762_21160 [Actinocorallia sp. API 0066]|uniref:DUF6790 family protein n=1 Tax=Actinocorallia sp. API 0066 TaxID=2896846 RepID=UPI001E65A005|nr:DUF6790 family protein [Actinocorallia sp. API 0066]MCD0451685.1 hypothetical protein [Actinocorallia sp. API 0066]